MSICKLEFDGRENLIYSNKDAHHDVFPRRSTPIMTVSSYELRCDIHSIICIIDGFLTVVLWVSYILLSYLLFIL